VPAGRHPSSLWAIAPEIAVLRQREGAARVSFSASAYGMPTALPVSPMLQWMAFASSRIEKVSLAAWTSIPGRA